MEDQTVPAAEYEDEARLVREQLHKRRSQVEVRPSSPDSDDSTPLLDRTSTYGERAGNGSSGERRRSSRQPWDDGFEKLHWTRRIGAALVSPHLGALSDRIGRKRVIAFVSAGSFMMEIITIMVGNNPDTMSPYWILLGYFFDGLCGSFTTAMALSYSYAADCTPPGHRNVAFGLFHGTLFTGMAIGPVLAGYLIEWAGNIMVIFYVALGCHIFFILFLLFFIPESVTKERQLIARQKWAAKKGYSDVYLIVRVLREVYNFHSPLSVLWPKGPGSSFQVRKNLVLLAAIDTAMFGVAMGTMGVIIIYAEYMFDWGNLESSKFMSATYSSRVATLVILLPLITRLVRGPRSMQSGRQKGADTLDIVLIRLSILFDLCGYIGYSIAHKGYVMIISGVIASVGGMGSPTLQSALTKHVPPDRTGQLLGATGLLHALARIVAPLVFNSIYALTVGKFNQAVFVCLASVFVLASLLSWFLKSGVFLIEDEDEHLDGLSENNDVTNDDNHA
ncbi:MAG: hypothetical protein Q9227_003077 [Pyrenula ochraceoflavens]